MALPSNSLQPVTPAKARKQPLRARTPCTARSRSTSAGSSPSSTQGTSSHAASSPVIQALQPVGPPPGLAFPQFLLALGANDAPATPFGGISATLGLEQAGVADDASYQEQQKDGLIDWRLAFRAQPPSPPQLAPVLDAKLAARISPPPLQPPILGLKLALAVSPPPWQAPTLKLAAFVAPPPTQATSLGTWSPLTPPPSHLPVLAMESLLLTVLPPHPQLPSLSKHVQRLPVAPPTLRAPTFVEESPPPPPAGAPALRPPAAAHVLRLAEALSVSELRASGLSTLGAAEHHLGTCKPCAFLYHPKGCGNGAECTFCHLCQPGEKKRRMKEKRDSFRQEKVD